MQRLLALSVVLLGCCSGCALMEDLMYGDDPWWDRTPPAVTGSQSGCCGSPTSTVSVAQTPEPEVSRK